LLEQQPFGQLLAVQGGGVHAWLTQIWPISEQFSHVWPPAPHCESPVPGEHSLPTVQQPV
jgi:hypothetical protein